MLYLTLPFIVQASPGAKQLKLLGEVNGEARRGSERPPLLPLLTSPLPPSPSPSLSDVGEAGASGLI